MNISQDALNFCCNIAYLRKKHGMTQAEMAKILDVGVGTVRKLEHGIIPPRLSAAVVCRVSDHFHIHPSTLFSPLER